MISIFLNIEFLSDREALHALRSEFFVFREEVT